MIAEHKSALLVLLLLALAAAIAFLWFCGEGLHLGAWHGPFGGGN